MTTGQRLNPPVYTPPEYEHFEGERLSLSPSPMREEVSRWRDYSWFETVKRIFQQMPEYVWGSIIGVESSGVTTALGDYQNGVPTSFGLYQIHTVGGLGDAYKDTPEALYDPALNAQIAFNAMRPNYEAAVQQGLSGYDLVEYVASHSGFPLMTGNMPDSYRERLKASYQVYETIGGAPDSASYYDPAHKYPVPDGISMVSPGGDFLHQLDQMEKGDISLLKPIESTKRMVIMVLVGFVGLLFLGAGLFAIIGKSGAAKLIAAVPSPIQPAAQAANAAAEAAGAD